VSITFEAIETILEPLHTVIAHTHNRELMQYSIALRSFVAGAKSASRHISYAFGNRMVPTSADLQTSSPSVYAEGLTGVIDDIQSYLNRISELAKPKFTVVEDLVDIANLDFTRLIGRPPRRTPLKKPQPAPGN
jgi:hypothetical protein